MNRIDHFEPNYFSLAEDAWQKCQGKILRFSSIDYAHLAALEDYGVSLEAVLLGIHQTFENRARMPLKPEVRNLRYCMPEIMEAHRQILEDSTAGHGELKRSIRRRFLGERFVKAPAVLLPVR